MTSVYRVSLVLLKPPNVVKNVAGLETVLIEGHSREGLPRLESLHTSQFGPLNLYRLLLFRDELEQFKQFLADRRFWVPQTIAFVKLGDHLTLNVVVVDATVILSEG